MRKLIILCLVAAALVGGWAWQTHRQTTAPEQNAFYGNVDIRQVALAFDNMGRIRELTVEEGDRVSKGQVLGVLDTRMLELQVAAQQAAVDAQRQAVLKLENGARPQEVAQATAQLALVQATQTLADQDLSRIEQLFVSESGAASQRSLEQAQAQAQAAQASTAQAQAALDLVQAGARPEDIAQAQAQLRGAEAQLDLLRHSLSLAELVAPDDGVVRTRLRQPGDMVNANVPVFALAITEPKWVRIYVSEPDLGRLAPGAAAQVLADGNPTPVSGQVGYISSVAEFTPKSVQTEELRSALVYEVHIIVDDRDDRLRLGQPVTVYLE